MIVTGTPARLRPLPRVLLFTELATSSTAVAAGWRGWVCRPVNDSARTKTAATPATVHTRKLPNDSGAVRVRTIAAAATFVLHTVRQAIYVSAGYARCVKAPESQPKSPTCWGGRGAGRQLAVRTRRKGCT
jgi:hypothetical protein